MLYGLSTVLLLSIIILALRLEKDAMKYDMSKVADLTLSLEYSNGAVKLDGDTGSLNMKI